MRPFQHEQNDLALIDALQVVPRREPQGLRAFLGSRLDDFPAVAEDEALDQAGNQHEVRGRINVLSKSLYEKFLEGKRRAKNYQLKVKQRNTNDNKVRSGDEKKNCRELAAAPVDEPMGWVLVVKDIFYDENLCLLESRAMKLCAFQKQLVLLVVGVEGTGEVADHAQLRLQDVEHRTRVEHVHEEENVVGLGAK